MSGTSDFTEADRWVVGTALKERYGEIIAPEPVDSEIRIDPASPHVIKNKQALTDDKISSANASAFFRLFCGLGN